MTRFFTSDRFKRLIVPFANNGLEASGATDRLFQAETTGTTFTSGTTDFTIPLAMTLQVATLTTEVTTTLPLMSTQYQ
jgi:hypothetical protein